MVQNDKDRAPDDSLLEKERLEQRAETPEEQEEINRMLREIRGDRSGTIPYTLRKLGYWIAGLALVAIIVLTFVLVQKVPFSTRVYGPSYIVPGKPVSYRIALFHGETTSFLKGLRATLWLHNKKGKTLLYKGSSTRKTLAANFQAPKLPPGEYELKVHATGSLGEEIVVRKVKVVTSPPFSGKPRKSYPNFVWYSRGGKSTPYLVRMLTEGRTLLADLPNWLHFQVLSNPGYVPPPKPDPSTATDGKTKKSDGNKASAKKGKAAPTDKKAAKGHGDSRKPVPPSGVKPPARRKAVLLAKDKVPVPLQGIQVWLQERKRTLGPFTTDARGFIRIPYIPNFFRVRWVVKLKGDKGEVLEKADLKAEGYEVAVALKKVIVPLGKPLEFKFDSISPKGTFHVDLLQKGRRVWTKEVEFKGSNRHVKIQPPAHLKGLCTLQVYTEFYMPGEVYDARLIYLGSPSRKSLEKALHNHLTERGDGLRILDLHAFTQKLQSKISLEQHARQLFGFSKARFFPPQRLYDSAKDKLKRLQKYRGRFRARTLVLLAILSSIVFLVSVGGMLWWYRKEAAAIRQLEMETGEVIQSRGLPYLVLFSSLLFAFFAVTIYLFWIMKFTFDG